MSVAYKATKLIYARRYSVLECVFNGPSIGGILDTGDLRDWLALSFTPGLGPAGCRILTDHFGSPGKVLTAGEKALSAVAGLKKNWREALLAGPRYREADREIARAANSGVRILPWADPDYPKLLRNIHNPPIILYVKGRVDLLQGPALGMVGARAASDYGKKIADNLAADLARHGLTIFSGLALGIDTAAHQGALRAGGNTAAVLGCGVDFVYPSHNRTLYERLCVDGALVSEYPLGTRPESFRFPARNRIISGLSLGVLVVEAAKRSGSLITAFLALEQGREVFAVPGRVDSLKSEGTHRLLKEGAKLVHSVEDIFEELPAHWRQEQGDFDQDSNREISENLDPLEKTVFVFLDAYPKTIEEIILGTGFSPQKAAELLLLLELHGLITSLPGKRYQRAS